MGHRPDLHWRNIPSKTPGPLRVFHADRGSPGNFTRLSGGWIPGTNYRLAVLLFLIHRAGFPSHIHPPRPPRIRFMALKKRKCRKSLPGNGQCDFTIFSTILTRISPHVPDGPGPGHSRFIRLLVHLFLDAGLPVPGTPFFTYQIRNMDNNNPTGRIPRILLLRLCGRPMGAQAGLHHIYQPNGNGTGHDHRPVGLRGGLPIDHPGIYVPGGFRYWILRWLWPSLLRGLPHRCEKHGHGLSIQPGPRCPIFHSSNHSPNCTTLQFECRNIPGGNIRPGHGYLDMGFPRNKGA